VQVMNGERVMSTSMNTALSGRGGADDNKGHPQGEIRGPAKLVKSTEILQFAKKSLGSLRKA